MNASSQPGSREQGRTDEFPTSFAQLIETFATLGEKRALTFYHKNRREALSYQELHAAICHWMTFLATRWSIGAGARVALCAYNETAVVPITLAVIAMGGVLVPLNPDSDIAFLEAVLDQAPADALLVGSDIPKPVHDYLACRTPRYLTIDGIVPPDSSRQGYQTLVSPPDSSLLLFTSGTTGRPKGVMLNQAALIANAASLIRNFKLSGTTQFAVMPLFHAHAFGFGLMTALLSGGHLVFARGVDPAIWKRAIQEQEAVYTSVVPSLLQMLLRMRVTQDDVPTLRAILVSSAPLTTELASRFRQSSGIRLINGWGLSEYTNFACCMRVAQDDDYYTDCLQGHPWPSIGHALDLTQLQIRDSEGVEVAQGEVGELWIKGPSTMRGYFNDCSATEETIRDGWLRTGDLGFCADSPQGAIYFITGRLKEIIIRGGEKIAPLAIEARLRKALPEWQGAHVAVVGYPSNVYGEEIGLYVHRDLNMEEEPFLKVMKQLPADIRPKIVIVGDEPIPSTHTGKVQRLKLQKHFTEYADYNGPVMLLNKRARSRPEDEKACRMS